MKPLKPRQKEKQKGFTLIELLVVLAIVALLLTLAAPRYFRSIDFSKEVVLMENLRLTRETIDKFYGDQGRYPQSLQELVDKRYLRSLPFDPVSENNDAWTIIPPVSGAQGQVYDIRSSADGQTRDGRLFNGL